VFYWITAVKSTINTISASQPINPSPWLTTLGVYYYKKSSLSLSNTFFSSLDHCSHSQLSFLVSCLKFNIGHNYRNSAKVTDGYRRVFQWNRNTRLHNSFFRRRGKITKPVSSCIVICVVVHVIKWPCLRTVLLACESFMFRAGVMFNHRAWQASRP
jgi:hypothetical protein